MSDVLHTPCTLDKFIIPIRGGAVRHCIMRDKFGKEVASWMGEITVSGIPESICKAVNDVAPVPMLLFCPQCEAQHIDAPNESANWTNPPHATHKCGSCGWLWRPSNTNTVGVASLPVLEPKHARLMASAFPKFTVS